MEYVTCEQASKMLGISERRVQQMCQKGELAGAIKEANSWKIPQTALPSTPIPSGKGRKPLPIGLSDFKRATSEYYYVDKTLLIRDFLDKKPQVSLFTRPRRFGKTLNMDMLRVFFEISEEDTSVYFKDKAIWSCGEQYTAYQGKFPVIFMTFKDVKCNAWENTYEKITKLISIEYCRHPELESSNKLSRYEKDQYTKIARNDASRVEFQMSLQLLSQFLYKHYNQETVIIIDEYDTPIQQGHTYGFYGEIVDFMRNFFSGGLKDNPYLAYGFLTGILRVAKESIFSGLNNLKVNSIMDHDYSSYFGFTEVEIKEMLAYYEATDKYQEICDWYDGYRFGSSEIFNPWSVVNYISENCTPKAFWQSTGSNDIIGEIIASASDEINKSLHKLLIGDTITTYIDTSVIYPEIQSNPYSIYSFLLIAGYLRITNIYPQDNGSYMCDVAIPNKEISFVYEKEILNKTGRESIAISIQQAIFLQNFEMLQQLLEEFMLKTVSSFDVANESFYHGMMIGLCAMLNNRYQVRSNRESGLGRFDIQLMPHRKDIPGFIFEFKYTKTDTEDLNMLAKTAYEQIIGKKYDTEMKSAGIENIIKFGIAFRGKTAVVYTPAEND